jgi:hypothetical protein
MQNSSQSKGQAPAIPTLGSIPILPPADFVPTLPLASECKIGGFTMRLIERKGQWAIYGQWKGGKCGDYEVIRIKVREAEDIHGKPYPKREVYPPSESWGTDGFTFMDLESARIRLAQLTK